MQGILTFQEVRRELRISELVMRNLLKSGSLKAARIGRQWRIARQNLDEFLKIKERSRNDGNKSKSRCTAVQTA